VTRQIHCHSTYVAMYAVLVGPDCPAATRSLDRDPAPSAPPVTSDWRQSDSCHIPDSRLARIAQHSRL
jgi:hypothetical protein